MAHWMPLSGRGGREQTRPARGGEHHRSGGPPLSAPLPCTALVAVQVPRVAANSMRAALAALLAAALLGAAAAQSDFCEGEGWEALQPEVRSMLLSS